MRKLQPDGIAKPFGNYAHGVELPAGSRIVKVSGQLGLTEGGAVPADAGAQADICFGNVAAILAEAGMTPADVFHISAFVTDRRHMAGYMAARDRFLKGAAIASTLMIVSGFTRPEFLVEVEAWAASD